MVIPYQTDTHIHTHHTIASGFSLLPSLCKLLYQLCEASSKSELECIHDGVGSLQPTALLLNEILELIRTISETNPKGFTKVFIIHACNIEINQECG